MKDEPLDRDAAPGRIWKALESPRFRVSDPLDAASGRVHGHLRQHVRPCNRVPRGLRESSLEPPLMVPGIGDVTAFGEKQPGADARRPRGQGIDLRQKQVAHPLLLSGSLEIPGEREQTVAALGPLRRCQAKRMLSQLDGVDAGSSGGRSAGRGRDGGGKLCIRMLGREREMPCAELLVADDGCHFEMELAPLVRTCPAPRRSGEQRVGRTHPVPVHKEQPSVERLLDGGWVCDCRELGQAQLPAQGDRQEQPSHRLRKRVHASAQEVLNGLGHRHVLTDGRRPMGGQGTSELEGEERVSESGLEQPAKDLARQAQLEAIRQHPSRRAEAEGTDLEPVELPPRERLLQIGGASGTFGEQKSYRLVLEPPRGERQHLVRRSVEPLDVIDGDQQRPPHRQRPQGVQEAERDRSGLRRNVGRLGAQERNLQRTQLRRRQPSQLLRAHTVEQID